MGATVSGGQQHPIKGGWWRGIPEKLGKAVVLGNVYQRLWPAFAAVSKIADGLAFASLEDWTTDGDLSQKVGEPPQDQLQIPDGLKGTLDADQIREYLAEVRRVGAQNPTKKYPGGWPFGEPFAARNG